MTFTPDLPSTEDALRAILSSSLPLVPPQEQSYGATTVSWWEMAPGEVYIHAEGGSPDDRHYASTLVAIELEPHGFKRAQFEMDQDVIHPESRRISSWPDCDKVSAMPLPSDPYDYLVQTLGLKEEPPYFIDAQGTKLRLKMEHDGEVMTIMEILCLPQGTGLGSRVVEALQDLADETGQYLEVNDAQNQSFWNRFSIPQVDPNEYALPEDALSSMSSFNELDPEVPQSLYHFAPPGSEAFIKANGIAPTELPRGVNMLGNGVYMYGYDPSYMYHPGAGELYHIDSRGLEDQLQPDYDLDGAWFHPGPIPPDRIRRLA